MYLHSEERSHNVLASDFEVSLDELSLEFLTCGSMNSAINEYSMNTPFTVFTLYEDCLLAVHGLITVVLHPTCHCQAAWLVQYLLLLNSNMCPSVTRSGY